MADLIHDELDLVVMGQVMAGCFLAETFHKRERSRSFTVFYHNGTRICQKTFLFLHTMGYGHFKAIKASFMANGVVARVHGNKGKSRRKDRLTLQQIEDVVQFVPGYKNSDVKLLPSSTTKHSIWEVYLQVAANSLMRALAYPTFT